MTDKILEAMGVPVTNVIQRIQTEHRMRLIEFWQIPAGARILEIGCGQGDTLAALAYLVGEAGFVHGVDIAGEDYGAPETLGEARKRLLNSEIGNRIRIDFGIDILNSQVEFAPLEYDYIILSHAIWYLSSYQELRQILTKIKSWGRNLCLAEWNPCMDSVGQLPHFQAVSIQAICSCFEGDRGLNVRTLFYPDDIRTAVEESGWVIDREGSISSSDMQDGKWEVDITLSVYENELFRISNMPEKLANILSAQIKELKKAEKIEPLSTFCLKASNMC